MTLSRRDFLAGTAALTGGAMLGLPRLGRAQSPEGLNKVILVYARGGWDPLFVLDPKDRAKVDTTLIDVPAGAVVGADGPLPFYDAANTGGAARSFFQRHGERCAIVRGVTVRSVSHTGCSKRFLTGTASDTSPDFAAIVGAEAAALDDSIPVPYMVLGSRAYSGDFASMTGRLGPTSQMLRLLGQDYAYDLQMGGSLDPIAPFPRPSDADGARIKAWLERRAARLRAARGGRGLNARRLDDYTNSLAYRDLLAATLKEQVSAETVKDLKGLSVSLEAQMSLANSVLNTGISWCVTLDTNLSWDSHQNNDTAQSSNVRELFRQLEAFIDTIDDQTTVAVVSEMGRTPKTNSDDGKDHWPVGCALLIGAGVKGGRAYGATDDTLKELAVDLRTGQPSESGVKVETDHLVAGILKCAGLSEAQIGQHLPGAPIYEAFVEG